MTFIDHVDFALRPPVKRVAAYKSDIKNNAKKQLGATANKTPEVVVKISGFGKQASGIRTHLNYITRDGEIEAETSEGQKIKGKDDVSKLTKKWTKEIVDPMRRRQRDVMNLILSMPPGTNPEALRRAGIEFSHEAFKQHKWVAVQHKDEAHPHLHIAIQLINNQGKKLDPRKEDLQRWREQFAKHLNLQNIAANATPRRARGVIKKPERQTTIHIKEKGKTPNIQTNAITEIITELKTGEKQKRPWETAIKERQINIRENYIAAAKELEKSDNKADQELAAATRKFISELPQKLETQRHTLLKEITNHLNKQNKEQPEIDR